MHDITDYYNNTQINGILFLYMGAKALINEPLNQILHRQSQLEHNPELWMKMHQQFEDKQLLENGFRRCIIENRKNCFCK